MDNDPKHENAENMIAKMAAAFTVEEQRQIDHLRARFLAEAERDSGQFAPKDIELVRRDPWWTLRFAKWNAGKLDRAYAQMLAAFRWRRSFGLHDRAVRDIPCEFAKAAAIFPYGVDRKGRPILYVRVKVYRKIAQLNLFFQQFVAGIVDHVDRLGGRRGFVIVYDTSGIGLRNYDLDFVQFLLRLLQQYYPYGVRYVIVYQLAKVFRPLWSVCKMFLRGGTAETFRFCDSADDLRRYIPSHYLLRYMGGESDFDFTDFAEVRGAPSVRELADSYGFSAADVERFMKMFEEQFAETDRIRLQLKSNA